MTTKPQTPTLPRAVWEFFLSQDPGNLDSTGENQWVLNQWVLNQ
jgi:hypothetical protein